MLSLDRRKVFSLVDFTLSRQGMVKGDKVFNKMKDFIPDTPIEDLRLPFAAVAVDLVNNREVVFREGNLFGAIRASVSIPSLPTGKKESSHEENLGYFNLIDKTISLMTYNMAQMSLKHFKPDVLIEVSRDSCGTYDFFKAEQLVEMGRVATEDALNKLSF